MRELTIIKDTLIDCWVNTGKKLKNEDIKNIAEELRDLAKGGIKSVTITPRY